MVKSPKENNEEGKGDKGLGGFAILDGVAQKALGRGF